MRVKVHYLSLRNFCNKMCHNINKSAEIANFQRMINFIEQELGNYMRCD